MENVVNGDKGVMNNGPYSMYVHFHNQTRTIAQRACTALTNSSVLARPP